MSIKDQIEWMQNLRIAYETSPARAHMDMCDAIIENLRKVEAQKPVMLWHHNTPAKRGVYPVKCDGPNPNQGFRYWDGERWCAWAPRYATAHRLGLDPTVRKAQIKRPVMYATKSKAQ